MKTPLQWFALGAGFGLMFAVGQFSTALLQASGRLANGSADDAGPSFPAPALLAQASLLAQGRGPTSPGPVRPPAGAPRTEAAPPVVVEEGGNSAATSDFLAVTGSYGVGTSVLYLIDTKARQLAVYEARGGSTEGRRVVLVGARRIDLDLQLLKYNDRSEYDYHDLRKLFDARGTGNTEPTTGLVPNK